MTRPLARRAFLSTAIAAGASLACARRGWADSDAGPIPIVDTHQHLWDLKQFNLPWLANAPRAINQSFDLDDFRAATKGLNVVKTVYMEVDVHPAQQVQEAEFAVALCEDANNRTAGAVIGGYPHDNGFADYLQRFAGNKWVKGVRTVLHAPDRPPGLCLSRQFIESMKRLGDVGLSFDLCMRRDELLSGAQLAASCPKTTFILDHCGNIGARPVESAARQLWCEGIRAAAAQPNVVCKISGLIDKAGDHDWTAATLADTVNFCLEAFGEDRVLFGGDWPVCLLGGSYKRWVETLQTIVSDRSPEFQRKLFHDNAVRVYRLA